MGLLAPWFLAGLAALSVPVYLHLLKQSQTKERKFSSLMFFERRLDTTVKQKRLRYLALLSLRLLVLLLIALAFTRPYWERKTSAFSGSTTSVIAVDRSFSMREGNRLQQAKDAALAQLNSVGRNRAQVIAWGGQVENLTQPTGDSAALRAAVQGITAGDGAASLSELARVLKATAENNKGLIDAHVYSDLQKSVLPASFGDLSLPANVRLHLHKIGGEAPNWYVAGVQSPAVVHGAGKRKVEAIIGGSGTGEAKRTVSLVMNGRTIESKDVLVPPLGRASVVFESLEPAFGENRCEVRIDSADGLKEDDRLYFSVQREEPRRVLFVHEPRERRSSVYVQAALDAGSGAAFTLEPVAASSAGDMDLKPYAFVVLSDVATLPHAFEQRLKRWVEAGGAVFITLGPEAAKRSEVPLLQASINSSRYQSRGGDRFQVAGDLDTAHPTLKLAQRWEGVRFYQAFGVDAGDARVVARLSDGTPVLQERKLGEGRVLLFTSTLDNVANDFPLHASFVPFIEQTALYLGGVEGRQASVKVGSAIELRTAADSKTSVEVTDPDGGRALSLAESTRAEVLPVSREGFWRVHRQNGRDELVAANADRRESELTAIPDETLRLLQSPATPQAASAGGAPTDETERRQIWWPLLFAALLAALAEAWLSARYLSTQREAA